MNAVDVKQKRDWSRSLPDLGVVEIDASLETAVSQMKTLNIHHLLVKEDGEFVGLLSARNCVGVWNPKTPVEAVMRSDLPPVDETTDIKTVVQLMVERNLDALPVRRNDSSYGIITTSDLLELLETQLSSHHEFSDIVEKGKEFFSRPVLQSMSRMLSEAGL